MKVVIGIVLISLVILGLIAYMILMLNAREMIFCGDLKNENGTNAQITRVYTTDLNANETLSEIIVKMNESDTESVQKSDITEVLAQYQNIIYAPVFTISVTQADSSTYIIDGQVFNGLDENGDPASPDYRHSKMQLNTVVTNGRIIAAQNVYDAGTAEAPGYPGRCIHRASARYRPDSHRRGFRGGVCFPGLRQLPRYR